MRPISPAAPYHLLIVQFQFSLLSFSSFSPAAPFLLNFFSFLLCFSAIFASYINWPAPSFFQRFFFLLLRMLSLKLILTGRPLILSHEVYSEAKPTGRTSFSPPSPAVILSPSASSSYELLTGIYIYTRISIFYKYIFIYLQSQYIYMPQSILCLMIPIIYHSHMNHQNMLSSFSHIIRIRNCYNPSYLLAYKLLFV